MKRHSVGWLAPLITALALSLMGASCSQVSDNSANAISPACKEMKETLAVCAFANYGTFVVIQELAVAVARDTSLPDSARQRIIRAEAAAKPVADSLYASLREYERIRIEVQAGKSPEQKLLTAAANLNRWVTEAAPLIRALVSAVSDASKGGAK
jgi:hypothetical protein